jgi:hypothetical protein
MSDEAEARALRRLRLMVINGFGGFGQLEFAEVLPEAAPR